MRILQRQEKAGSYYVTLSCCLVLLSSDTVLEIYSLSDIFQLHFLLSMSLALFILCCVTMTSFLCVSDVPQRHISAPWHSVLDASFQLNLGGTGHHRSERSSVSFICESSDGQEQSLCSICENDLHWFCTMSSIHNNMIS